MVVEIIKPFTDQTQLAVMPHLVKRSEILRLEEQAVAV
jgi:hypothetical protein